MSAVDYKAFFVPIVQSVMAGIVLAILFFAWRELVLTPEPAIGGPWYCVTRTTQSDFSNYLGLELGWRIVLLQNGNNVSGSSEKVWEFGRGPIRPSMIDRGEVDGFLQYNYLFASRLSMHQEITPANNRVTSQSFDLRVLGDRLHGTFYWTAADQYGDVGCQREPIIIWGDEELRDHLLR